MEYCCYHSTSYHHSKDFDMGNRREIERTSSWSGIYTVSNGCYSYYCHSTEASGGHTTIETNSWVLGRSSGEYSIVRRCRTISYSSVSSSLCKPHKVG